MKQDIYNSPLSNLVATEKERNGKLLAICGGILQLPLLVCSILFIVGLIQIYMASTLYGIADAKALAGGISEEMVSLILGSLLALPGFAITIFLLIKRNYRSRWFTVMNSFYSVLWLFVVPVGTVLGITYMCIMYVKRGSKINA